MEVKSFTNLESTLLSKFNEGNTTFEQLKNVVPFSDKTLNQVIESLTAKHVIELDKISKKYKYCIPVNGEKIILDGNIMLPTTIIHQADKILISRGSWYSFPLDFDIRRIIWNVKLPTTKNSTLVDMIKDSVMKERKSRIIQLPEYKVLANKLIPYSQDVMLKINVVGEEYTDVHIMFKKRLTGKDDDIKVEFRGMLVRSEIKTDELLAEIHKPVTDRDWKNISINRIFGFSDFIFSNNEIPYAYSAKERILSYAKITGIRGKIEITYFTMNVFGEIQKINVEQYEDSADGISKLKELFNSYAVKMVENEDFLIE